MLASMAGKSSGATWECDFEPSPFNRAIIADHHVVLFVI
jgi:hypothetical protein